MSWRFVIPNLFTLANLVLGVLAILQAAEGQLVSAAYLVALAAVLDFFDGFFARLLNAQSAIGKDLDSLADNVTFGVTPALVWYYFAQSSGENWYNYLALSISVCAALRLARFNNDDSQSNSFLGLPSPAAALFVVSLPLIAELDQFGLGSILLSAEALSFIPVGIALLMIAPIRLFSLKFKGFSWKGHAHQYILILISMALLISFQFLAIPLIILTYIFLSLLRNFAT